MDQVGYTFLLALMVIICNIIWSLQALQSMILGISQEQNFEISVALTSSTYITQKLLHAAARPKQGNTAAFTLQHQPREETAPKRCPYHVPLGITTINKLPQKWAKNEEVLCQFGRKAQGFTLHKCKEAFSYWWPGPCFFKHPGCPTCPETYTETELKNHWWSLPHHYIPMVEDSKSTHQTHSSRRWTVWRFYHQIWGTKSSILLRCIPTRILQRQYKPLDVSKLFELWSPNWCLKAKVRTGEIPFQM